uniref:Hpt domain-containing protein n=1 Tax=Acidobacterium capsulatum TaxID=33075 RepID=A0A7V4XSK9_9BACT
MALDDEKLATIQIKLDAIWKASKPALLERLATLESSCGEWLDHPENEDARQTAHDAAHKLAGVLGTFGLARGSQIASEIERIVSTPGHEPLPQMPHLLAELREMIVVKQ